LLVDKALGLGDEFRGTAKIIVIVAHGFDLSWDAFRRNAPAGILFRKAQAPGGALSVITM